MERGNIVEHLQTTARTGIGAFRNRGGAGSRVRAHLVAILATGLSLVPTASNAITIAAEPANQILVVGETSTIAITISGLGGFLAPSLSTFDLDVTFDDSVVAFSGITFGDPALGDQLDLFGLGSITDVDASTPGVVNVFELSFDLPSDLDTLQAGAFTLATLDFTMTGIGTSAIDIGINALGDSLGNALGAEVQNGMVRATPGMVQAIPEPSPVLAFSFGLVIVSSVFSGRMNRHHVAPQRRRAIRQSHQARPIDSIARGQCQ